jgi:transcription initiation factor TFIID subunit 7
MQAPKITIKKIAPKKDVDEALQEAPTEEHFVIRFPPALANQLREPIAKREVPFDLQLNWKDSRHGKFTYGNKSYNATLVDLPCITESLKTIDNKQFYKIADVSQMVVVHESRYHGPKDYAWPDGLTYPLRNVRNARFRKRMSKRVIEDVEAEVERLLAADLEAEDVRYEVHDRRENEDMDEDEEMEESEAGDEENDDFDLEAAIDEAIDKDDGKDGDDNQDEDSDNESEESDNESEQEDNQSDGGDQDEHNELKIQAKALRSEIQVLESKLHEKNMQVENQVNAIMKERFKGIVSKLAMELSHKKEQLQKVEEEILNEEED